MLTCFRPFFVENVYENRIRKATVIPKTCSCDQAHQSNRQHKKRKKVNENIHDETEMRELIRQPLVLFLLAEERIMSNTKL